MLKAHYSASELAAMKLPGMPETRQNIIVRAIKEGWLSRTRSGRGGGKEYALDGMPQKVQAAIREREAKQALALMPKSQLPAVIEHVRASDTEHQRLIADARKGVLAALDKIMQSHGIKLKPAARKLLALAAEEPEGQLARMLKLARDPRGGTGDLPTVRSLQRLAVRAETDTLSPRMPLADMSIPEWAEAFMACYRRPEKPSVQHAYENFAIQWMMQNSALPSLHQVRRWLAKVGNVSREVGRLGSRELLSKKGFVRRRFEHLLPCDIYSADGHCFDSEVQHPDHGRPFRPEITSVIDIATRRVVGWSVSLAESSLAVLNAFRRAVELSGVPAIFYVDNGSGYVNGMMQDAAVGFMARLEVTMVHSVPYRSQARGAIERLHKSLWVKAAKDLPGYIGKDMDAQAKQIMHKASRKAIKMRDIGQDVKMPLLSFAEFVTYCEGKVQEYNNRSHRSLPKIVADGITRHMTPNEMWAQKVAAGFEPHMLSEVESAMIWRPQTLRVVQRCEVVIHNKRYHNAALEEWHGEQLRVAYDVHDPARVWIYDPDGRFICAAELNGNQADYHKTSFVEQARDKRAQGRLKRLDLARAEVLEELHSGRPAIEYQETIQIGTHILTREDTKLPIAQAEPEPLQLYIPTKKQAAELPLPIGWHVPETPEARFAEYEKLCGLPTSELSEEQRYWLAVYPKSGEYGGFMSLKKSTHTRIRKSA